MSADTNQLEYLIEKAETEEEKIDAINQLAWLKRRNEIQKSFDLASEALDRSEKIEYVKGTAYSKFSLAFHDYTTQGKIKQAITTFHEVIDMFTDLQDDYGRGMAHSLLSYIYWSTADYENGFHHLLEGEVFQEKSGNKEGMAWDKFNFGSYYSELHYLDLAGPYFTDSLSLFEELDEHFGRASSINGLAGICREKGDHELAIKHCEESIAISDKYGFLDSKASALKILGEVYGELKDFEKAIKYTKESSEIYQTAGDQQGYVGANVNLGVFYCNAEQMDNALKYFGMVLQEGESIDAFSSMIKAHEYIANIYGEIGKSGEALSHYKKYVKLKEQVMGDTSSNQMQKMQAVFNVKQARQETEIQRLRNTELAEANREIELQKEKVLSSIRYAKRIQDSMLSPISSLDKELKEVFMIFKPKDIVSGDFYWFNTVNDYFVMAAIDCTGHGVPGAFMTLMGNSLLNSIILKDKIVDPSQILYELDKRLLNNLASDSASQSNDGMDMTIVSINRKEGTFMFSGAKNPLFIIKDGEGELIKGSKFPIGSQQFKKPKVFETSTFDIDPNAAYYLFSDGYPDQFGGEGGRSKFLSKRFRALLTEISDQPLTDQKARLENELQTWMGDTKQTDDIIVMGFRI